MTSVGNLPQKSVITVYLTAVFSFPDDSHSLSIIHSQNYRIPPLTFCVLHLIIEGATEG